MRKIFLLSIAIVLFLSSTKSSAQNPIDYQQRQQAYRDSVTTPANFLQNAITVQAFKGQTIDSASLHTIYGNMTTKSTIDFDIVKLIRVLFLTNGSYDTAILNSLNQVPFWFNHSDTIRGYWSENHMIMWMSSDWLLHESYGKTIDATLEQRLKHYLQLKIDYGFYEFFSSTYFPYTLSGLLNLVDFAQDPVIVDLATQAAQRLMKDLLMVSSDKGVYYPATGRNNWDKYINPYQQNQFNLIWLLTGFGEAPNQVSHSGGFLSTSDIDVNPVINSWSSSIDTIYKIGHSIDSTRIIHQDLVQLDRIMMQWSGGGYFHPEFALETATLLADSNTWNHVDFEQLRIVGDLPLGIVENLANQLTSISKSSVILGQDVAIFKNNSVVLTSIQDFWKGKLGYQQIPIAATVETSGIVLASGKVTDKLSDRTASNRNDHLPYVEQKSNVALVMYRAEEKTEIFGSTIADVVLQWKTQDFDEVIEKGNWILGRINNSYAAVRRHCTDTQKGQYACDQRDGQTWVITVGNDSMYGSFNNFESLVDQSNFESYWFLDSTNNDWVYHSEITFDNKTIDYDWRDTLRITSIKNVEKELEGIEIYPNPIQDFVYLNFSDGKDDLVQISVHNNLGQRIYHENNVLFSGRKTLNTADWSQGIYFITVEDKNAQQRYTRKLIKVE